MTRTPDDRVHTCLVTPAHRCPACAWENYDWEDTPEENFWDDRTTPMAYGRQDSERDMAARRAAVNPSN